MQHKRRRDLWPSTHCFQGTRGLHQGHAILNGHHGTACTISGITRGHSRILDDHLVTHCYFQVSACLIKIRRLIYV